MNNTLNIGEFNTLIIDRKTVPGLFLRSLNGEEVLLPNQYITDFMHIGDTLDVFIYNDSEDRPVATTLEPKVIINEIGFLEVIDTSPIGAFLNWGLPKDLFVPKNLQKRPFNIGEKRLIRVILDDRTQRLVATEKITAGLLPAPKTFVKNFPVSFIVIAKTPLGYKVVVDHLYEGMIYTNEVFETIRIGQYKNGFVKLRRTDGKLDLSLQPIGKGVKASTGADKVLQLLLDNGGMLPYNYKSDPDLIQQKFGLSKKNFKSALTQLVTENKIKIEETGIYGI